MVASKIEFKNPLLDQTTVFDDALNINITRIKTSKNFEAIERYEHMFNRATEVKILN